MRKRILLLGIALSPAAVLGALRDRHVVVVSIDGFPAAMLRDPSLPVPNLRRLAAAGAKADAMTVSNPSGTWINHTTMVTGVSPRRHGVLFNGLLVRGGPDEPPHVEQWADKEQMVLVPTLYDLAARAGLTTAESDWVAITRAPTVQWSFPEIPQPTGRVEQEMIAAGLLTEEQIGWMQHRPGRKQMVWHDEMWTKAACFMFERHRPNLLLYHTLNTDLAHHLYGPGSSPGYTALAYADRLLGDVVAAVERSGRLEQTTFFVVSDHGFKPVAKIGLPNVALKRAGYAEAQGAKVTRGAVTAVGGGGIAFVYVNDRARRAELLPRLRQLFSTTEGISRVLDGAEAPSLGMPTPDENPGMGDLILVAADGYTLQSEADGEAVVRPAVNYAGTHGSLASEPELDAIFVASGAGIRRGVELGRVSNLDVAPTIAALLEINLPDAEGKPIREILEDSATR